jgi:hypothetical protein
VQRAFHFGTAASENKKGEKEMGFLRFRRSIKIIPGVRLNLSKSGGSVSLGVRGAHYTIGAKGARTTVGIPGSGLSWTQYSPYSASHSAEHPDGSPADIAPRSLVDGPEANVFESAGIDEMVANSTAEIAQTLDRNENRWRAHKALLTVLAFLFAGGVVASGLIGAAQPLVVGLGLASCVAWIALAIYLRQSCATWVQYDLSASEIGPFNGLNSAFDNLVRSDRIWQIPVETRETDWKRNAGAATTVQRKRIALGFGNPSLVKSNIKFPRMSLLNEVLYFTPDAVLVLAQGSLAALRYSDVEVDCSSQKFIEDDGASGDAQVVDETWQYVNRDGGPDRRFANNRKLPICLYGQLDIRSTKGLTVRLHCSNLKAPQEFVAGFLAMSNSANVTKSAGGQSVPVAGTAPIPDDRERSEESVSAAYANETDLARTLATQHGKFWEFLLIQELLRSRVQTLRVQYDRFDDLLRSTPKKQFTGQQFIDWLMSEFDHLISVNAKIKTYVEEGLFASLGPPGVTGDAIKILGTVNALFEECRTYLNFEFSVFASDVPTSVKDLQAAFHGITLTVINLLDELEGEWSRNVEGMQKGSHRFELKVTLKNPPQLDEASNEIARVKEHPELLR